MSQIFGCGASPLYLDPEIRNSPSLAIFKSRLIKLIRPDRNEIYNVFEPNGLRFLTQLRVRLNVLREHKFRHSFCDTSDPMCLLNDGVENTEHYMLLCQDFNQQRILFHGKVSDVLSEVGINMNDLSQRALLNILLYGDSRLSCTPNRRIISATLDGIHLRIWSNELSCIHPLSFPPCIPHLSSPFLFSFPLFCVVLVMFYV